MRYGDLIRDAFGIAWRNKFLWFFGFFFLIFSSTGSGGGGGGGSDGQQDFDFGQSTGGLSSISTNVLAEPVASAKAAAVQFPLLLQSDGSVFFVVALFLVVLVLFVVFVAMNLISQAALAEGVTAIKGGSARGFGQSFGVGLSHLLRLFVQGVLFIVIEIAFAILILFVAGLPILLTFLLSQSTGLRIAMTVIFAFVAILLFIVVFIPLAIIGQLAVREMVVGGSGITSSIGRAYRLFRARLGSALLVWLLNIGLKIAITIAALIAAVLVGLILVGPGIGIAAAGAETAGLIVGAIGGVVFLIIAIVVIGAVGTFIHAYWTLAYLQLTGRDVRPEEARPAPIQ